MEAKKTAWYEFLLPPYLLINLFGMVKSKAFICLNKVTNKVPKGVQELLGREKCARGSIVIGKETEAQDGNEKPSHPVSHCLGFVTETAGKAKTLQKPF